MNEFIFLKCRVKVTIIFSIVLSFGILIGFSYYYPDFLLEKQNYSESTQPRAVIIDQLSVELPNIDFHTQARKIFEDAGYEVDIISSPDITVDFYKNLPEMNYKYIVFRSHAVGKISEDFPVAIFTGEKYTEKKYILEQALGYVKKAAPIGFREFQAHNDKSENWIFVNDTYRYFQKPAKYETSSENEFFAISPKMVDDLMEGKFPSSTILLGGCSTMSNHSMAESFLKKGASMVVGWDEIVYSSTNDRALLFLIEKTIGENQQMPKAIESFLADSSNYSTDSGARLTYLNNNQLFT